MSESLSEEVNMLSKPVNGWTEFCLGDKTYSLSYTDDIPFTWIRQAIHGLTNSIPFCVVGDEEPGTVICVVGWDCHLIFEPDYKSVQKGQIEHYYSNVDAVMFSEMLYKDIVENFDEWVSFYWIANNYNIQERRAELNSLLQRLSSLIDTKRSSSDNYPFRKITHLKQY